MLAFLYNLIILPLIYLYEFIFEAFCRIIIRVMPNISDPYFIGIIVVSIAVNILSFPLYSAADKIQQRERDKQKEMSRVVEHINKTFKGDERFMILNTYYKLESYNPIYSLKTAVPLLLQIPFFTAAYIFFNESNVFSGVQLSFFPLLKDLSKPDTIFNISGFNINVLPVIMTIINLLAAFIYTSDLKISDKIQPIVLALVFLVILYDSPSALVIYWTMNNVFSLFKAVVMKLDAKRSHKLNVDNDITSEDRIKLQDSNKLAILSLLTIFATMGLFIPTNIISASPTEFVIDNKLPYGIIAFAAIVYLGFFLWELLYVNMLPKCRKVIISVILFGVSIYLLLNHFLFLNDAGIITENLYYTLEFKHFTKKDLLVDLGIIIASFLLIILALKWMKVTIKISLLVLCSIIAVSIFNVYGIHKEILHSNVVMKENESSELEYNDKFKISKNGKNVIVIMLDRSTGVYVDYVFSHLTELKKEYDGFTFYDNALTCNPNTLFAAPSLFGGYDYLVQNINKRKDTLLIDKHNEALTIMPYNFSKNGFNCKVGFIPFENYEIAGKESIFEGMQNVSRISFENVAENYFYNKDKGLNEKARKRKFVFYSFMKVSPVAIKGVIYSDGFYLSDVGMLMHKVLKNYYQFNAMIDQCEIVDDDSNNFLMCDNELTHNEERILLPYGTFDVGGAESLFGGKDSDLIDGYPDMYNSKGELFKGEHPHFSTEAAAYMQIGKLLKFLKDNDVYDNTRIVITSDHGNNAEISLKSEYTIDVDGREVCTLRYNCALLYKDFNTHGDFKIDSTFMSNADTPLLAMKDIISNPTNPYLNKNIGIEDKYVNDFDIYGLNKGWNASAYINDTTYGKYICTSKKLDIFNSNDWYVKEDYID